MAKIKWLLISAAFITAIAGAYASSTKLPCESLPQYYKFAGAYFPAGDLGVDYWCETAPSNCTWYQPNPFQPNTYSPCRMGLFHFLP